MNWIKENKFLTGFLALLVAGAAALVYFLMAWQGSFTEASDNYYKQAEELKRLQSLVPYPDEGNLKQMREKKDEYVAGIAKLVGELRTYEVPVEQVKPEEFQDILKKTVDAVIEKADHGVLPAKFYLGFDVYQTKPPGSPQTAAALARELKAIDLLVNILINAKVTAITDVKRFPIPEETDPKAAARKQLVSKVPVEITFIGEQGRLRKALDEIVSSSKQFFILRSLAVRNEKERGPARGEMNVQQAGAPGADDTQKLKIIVGTEKLSVTARLEIVDFAPPATK